MRTLSARLAQSLAAIAILTVFSISPTLAEQPLPDRPADLSQFVSVNAYASLDAAIAAEDRIYLPKGTYQINNPIIIDRATPLFLFGAGQGNSTTRIIPKDKNQPLFIVRNVARLDIYGIGFDQGYPSSGGQLGVIAFDFENTSPVQFEMQESTLQRTTMQINGPVTAILQQVSISDQVGMAPYNTDGLLINHPQAEVYLSGFGAVRHVHHVHQISGHLEIYGMTTGYATSDDIVIESPSPKEAHIIAGVRSEGTDTALPGRLLTVPPTSAEVNVVVKGSMYAGTSTTKAPLIDYNGAGKLWIISTNGDSSVNALVDGDAPQATIVALGNHVEGAAYPPVLFPIAAKSGSTFILLSNCNLYDYQTASGKSDPPYIRFADGCIDNPGIIPTIPNPSNGIVQKLNRPTITALPQGLLTSVTDFGAIPDDGVDDTAAIQAALDQVGPFLYFPAGTYNISAPLTIKDRNGGLIAGAGSAHTRIVTSSDITTVFQTDGMAGVTWQGIYMDVPQKKAASGSVFVIGWDHSDGGVAASGNSFYDVVFDGSRYGISMGDAVSTWNCSETMIVDSAFKNTHVGLATGAWNALNQWMNGVTFDSNEYNVGFMDGRSGGSFYILDGLASHTAIADIQNVNAGEGSIYINHYSSDAPGLFSMNSMSASKVVLFDNSSFSPLAVSNPYYSWRAAGGVTFMRTSISNNNTATIHQNYDSYQWAEKYAMSIYSNIQDWDSIALDGNSKKYLLSF